MKTETVFHRCDEHAKLRAEMRLRKQQRCWVSRSFSKIQNELSIH